jgi:hypothetical protein
MTSANNGKDLQFLLYRQQRTVRRHIFRESANTFSQSDTLMAAKLAYLAQLNILLTGSA